MLQQPPPSLMRQKSMLLLGKLLRTKEPDIEPESDKKKVSVRSVVINSVLRMPKCLPCLLDTV